MELRTMDIFTDSFGAYACDGDTITAKHDGFTFTATIHHDGDMGEPWREHDGHGPVSDWTSRDKKAGELVLISDGRSKRYYDFAEAVKLAKRDQWGVKGGKIDGETSGQYAARAARHDFDVLQAWCNDEWSWCGVSVTVSRNGVQLVDDYQCALWGIDLNYPGSDNSYLVEVANDYASEALDAAKAKLASLCECESA
jgi:hypothetical protein